jgi:acylpyruvate hydrolase
MKLVTFCKHSQTGTGFLLNNQVTDIRACAHIAGWAAENIPQSIRTLLEMPFEQMLELHSIAETKHDLLKSESAIYAIDELRFAPPIPDPQKIIGIGLNYQDHANEVGATPPTEPIFFAKFANSLIGEKDDIVPPRDTQQIDYEAELAVVIGRRGRYIDEADALSHVAGAMVFNDVSARDLQMANQLWSGGKAIDTFGPCGPALVTIDEIDDLQNLRLQTRVNGETLQDGTTASMIFPVTRLISFLSRIMTLEPGDIIATGTPAGVGFSRNPPRYLQPGDLVEVEIDGLGMTRNQVVEPA